MCHLQHNQFWRTSCSATSLFSSPSSSHCLLVAQRDKKVGATLDFLENTYSTKWKPRTQFKLPLLAAFFWVVVISRVHLARNPKLNFTGVPNQTKSWPARYFTVNFVLSSTKRKARRQSNLSFNARGYSGMSRSSTMRVVTQI